MNPVTNKDIMEELQVLKSEKQMTKQRNQVKSRFYYIFWGAATVSVLAGQLFVGTGFRRMATSFDRIIDTIIVELYKEVPLHIWEDDEERHPMVIR